MSLQFEELENVMDYEHEVLISEELGVQLSKKSLTDNSVVYNVYIIRENGGQLVEYSPANLTAARRLFKILAEEGRFAPYPARVFPERKLVPRLEVDEIPVSAVRLLDQQILGRICRRCPASETTHGRFVQALRNKLRRRTDADNPKHQLVFGIFRVQPVG